MIATTRNLARMACAFAALWAGHRLVAQAPLVPAWENTWPFGQDGQPLLAPTGKDNHVTVDAATGLIYCTISDEDLLLSPRNELVFSFDAAGNDVTPEVPRVLGKAQFQYLYDSPYNGHATFGFHVFDGKVIAAHSYSQEGTWAPYITGGPLETDRWLMNADLPLPGPVAFSVAIGDGGALIQADGRVMCVEPGGWMKWRHSTASSTRACAVHNGVAWLLNSTGQVERVQMNDGTVLPSIAVAEGGQYFAVNDDHVFQASADFAGNITVVKTDLFGAQVYSTTTNVGTMGELTGLVVDDTGRAWTTFTVQDVDNVAVSGQLVGFDPAGGVIGRSVYGASMNGIATDGERLFITGWSNTATSETYLLAAEASLITSTEDTDMDRTGLLVWPQPASDELDLKLPHGATSITLLDGLGRIVRSWPSAAFAERATLDVSGIAQGSYIVRVQQHGQVLARPVVIQR